MMALDPVSARLLVAAVQKAKDSKLFWTILIGGILLLALLVSFFFSVLGVLAASFSNNTSSDFLWPIQGMETTLSSTFGMRTDPVSHKYQLHAGVDIIGKTKPIKHHEIVAAAAGTVEFAGYTDGGFGNHVILDNGNGIETLYGHCWKLSVNKGDVVTQGQLIGYVGNTGDSTGYHLHFGVKKKGDWVDPMTFTYSYNSAGVSDVMLKYIESKEGFSATPYHGLDSDNLTIGYGHVIAADETFTTITKLDAENLLANDLQRFEKSVNTEFAQTYLDQNQFDALVSLSYNLGAYVWDSIDLTQDIKSGADKSTIEKDFLSLDHVNGVEVPGLKKRRQEEYNIYETGKYPE